MILKIEVNALISWLMKINLILFLPYLIYSGSYLYAMADFLAILVLLAPVLISRNYNVHLPWIFDFLITMALWIHISGLVWRFYDIVPYYDVFAHFIGTFIIAMLAFTITFTLHYTGKLRLNDNFIVLFTIVFAIAIGSLWEISEFLFDTFIGTNAQRGLTNTMLDLIVDTLSGAIAAFSGLIYIKYTSKIKLRTVINPFKAWLVSKNVKKSHRKRKRK